MSDSADSGNDTHDVLDDDLRRLFADERLSLAPAAGAAEAIAAGARRVRRRREFALAGGGVAGVVALAAGLAFIVAAEPEQQRAPSIAAQPGFTGAPLMPSPGTTEQAPQPRTRAQVPASPQPRDAPERDERNERIPPAPLSTTPPATGVEEEPEVQEGWTMMAAVVGPSGYGQLALGMSFDEVKESGALADEDARPPKGCQSYRLAEGQDSVREIAISEDDGLAVIVASGARTPEGEGIGSSVSALRESYPKGTEGPESYSASSGEGGFYLFRLADDAAEGLALVLDGQSSCQ